MGDPGDTQSPSKKVAQTWGQGAGGLLAKLGTLSKNRPEGANTGTKTDPEGITNPHSVPYSHQNDGRPWRQTVSK